MIKVYLLMLILFTSCSNYKNKNVNSSRGELTLCVKESNGLTHEYKIFKKDNSIYRVFNVSVENSNQVLVKDYNSNEYKKLFSLKLTKPYQGQYYLPRGFLVIENYTDYLNDFRSRYIKQKVTKILKYDNNKIFRIICQPNDTLKFSKDAYSHKDLVSVQYLWNNNENTLIGVIQIYDSSKIIGEVKYDKYYWYDASYSQLFKNLKFEY